MAENTQIVEVKRAHQWVVKRDDPAKRCRNCGATQSLLTPLVCYIEEVEQVMPASGE